MGAEAEDVGGEGGVCPRKAPEGPCSVTTSSPFHDFSTQEPDSISQFSTSRGAMMGPAWVVFLLRGRIPRAQS